MRKILTFVSCILCLNSLSSQSNFIHQDTIFGRTANCATGVPVCIDSVLYDSVNSFRYVLDGQPFNGTVKPCSTTILGSYGLSIIYTNRQTGPWKLDSWTVNGRTFSTAFDNTIALFDSMQHWDPSGNWRLDTSSHTVYGYNTTNSQYSIQKISVPSDPNVQIEAGYNYGTAIKGLRFYVSAGIHQLIVEEILTGQRDTVTLVAACMSADTVRKTVVTQSSNYYCFDASRLPGRAGKLFNVCNNNSPESLFDAPSDGCMRYLGRRIGVDTACLMRCDDLGNCATTTLIVTTKYTFERGTRVYDTISVGSSRVLKSIAAPIGNITRMMNINQAPLGLSASFDINQATKTLTLSGLAVGQDTAYILVCSQFGYCDTTYLYITIVAAQQIMVVDTARIYRLVARSSQKALSIRNASTSLAADAVQAEATSGLNQKWTIKNADIDAFSLSVQHTNMNLDTRWGTKRSGSRLMQWSKNASLSQKWLFIPIGNGYFKIINKASGRALSINGGTAVNTNNAYLVQSNYEGLTSQQWRLEPVL